MKLLYLDLQTNFVQKILVLYDVGYTSPHNIYNETNMRESSYEGALIILQRRICLVTTIIEVLMDAVSIHSQLAFS